MPDTLSMQALLSDKAASLYAYWRAKANGLVPARRALDPLLEIPGLVADTFLLDRVGGRWRYRLVGTKIVRHAGRDVTGRFFDELYGDGSRFGLVWLERILAERVPVHFYGPATMGPARGWGTIELLYLPLAAEPDGEITQLFGGMWFPPEWNAGSLAGWRPIAASKLVA
jgi:hypothetical protein